MLTIKDLEMNKKLDGKAMASVYGGTCVRTFRRNGTLKQEVCWEDSSKSSSSTISPTLGLAM